MANFYSDLALQQMSGTQAAQLQQQLTAGNGYWNAALGGITLGTANTSNIQIGQFNPVYTPPAVVAPVAMDDPVQWLKRRVEEMCWKGVQ